MLHALDLYCCGGGATRGLQQAGFVVTGVDIEPQPHYCGDAFIQADALAVLLNLDVQRFDLIWASPPCQAHTALKVLHNAHQHEDLIAATRALLIASGRPWVIENVVGAPLINPVMLCGTSFGLQTAGGAQLQRRRLFEASFPLTAPPCWHDDSKPTIGIYGGHFRNRRRPKGKNHQSGSNFSVVDGRAAMGTPWLTVGEISQAIPPAFSRYIAEQFLAQFATDSGVPAQTVEKPPFATGPGGSAPDEAAGGRRLRASTSCGQFNRSVKKQRIGLN